MAFYRMDVRKLSDEEIAKLGIVAMPTFMVFREGRKIVFYPFGLVELWDWDGGGGGGGGGGCIRFAFGWVA
ncbi:unnamed protein product [Aspergillus oryzae var. brunneus]|uniref:Unnamed protein product n=1 Tax=Aspergillus oryzae var. brunneus TaxID=332754 RepID=A0ABQ6KT00_ASPOZ|nr:unnamed protein product [Aspergillus oryzae]GMG46517.1 unnamed protein product [Aspergillus oryzae var. brunneus]